MSHQLPVPLSVTLQPHTGHQAMAPRCHANTPLALAFTDTKLVHTLVTAKWCLSDSVFFSTEDTRPSLLCHCGLRVWGFAFLSVLRESITSVALTATSAPHVVPWFLKHFVAFWPQIFQALSVLSLPQHGGPLFVQGSLVPCTELLKIKFYSFFKE